jgi:predicted PurR-regulated permease PerM
MSSNTISYRKAAALTIILIFGIFLIYSLSSFINAFLTAIILYVMMRPAIRYLVMKKKWNKPLTISLLFIISFITVLLPFWGLYQLLYTKINYALAHSSELMGALQQLDTYVFKETGIRIISPETTIKLQNTLASIIPDLLGRTANVLTDALMMYFLLYFLLDNVNRNEVLLEKVIPLSSERSRRFNDELEAQVYSNVLGAPLLAVLQGLAAGFGFWIFGFDEPWFWGIICGFMSFLPLLGTALVWIPAGLYQMINVSNWQGIAILVYGILVITNIDNVFRFVLQKKFADVHPVVTVLGVIMGFNWFGIAGLIFGPLLISYFLILVKIYWEEFGEPSTK